MSPLLIVVYLISAVYVFSQIGGKLTARNALTWILVFGLLGFAVFFPTALQPVAHFFGVQLVSNFVIAGLILFLIFQAMQESAFTTRTARKVRDLVSTLAADRAEAILPHGSKEGRTLVVIPCFNEALNLDSLIREIIRFRESQLSQSSVNRLVDFLIIDDGSTDGSRERLKRQSEIPALCLATNVGVSAVTLTGFKIALFAGYSQIGQFDADGQHPIDLLPSLIQKMRDANSDLVIGSRYFDEKRFDESTTRARVFGSVLIQIALRFFSKRARITDPTSGFRVYSMKAVRALISRMPDEYPEPESIAVLLSVGCKIDEVQVKMNPRTAGVSSLSGIKGPKFMIKVLGSLLGLRLRAWLK